MDKQVIITIGRNFGSNGKRIGERLAREAGIGFYDKNLIHLAEERSGVRKEIIRNADEKILNRFTEFYNDYGLGMESTNEKIFRAQSAVIREIADSGESSVIVGRLADYVLRDHENVLRVFIYAPPEHRIRVVMKRYDLKKSQAEKVIARVDKERRNYYQYFSDENWDRKEGKDLMLDSSKIGIEGSVEVLKTMLLMRFGGEYFD